MRKRKKTAQKRHKPANGSERKAILDERRDLQRRFSAVYTPQIGIFDENKVEVMLTMSRSQAENLARLLKEKRL